MKTNRANEIISQFNAFSKDKYTKKELLPEMLQLQQEMVQLTFNESHAETAGLRIWDVEKHLEQLNNEHGNIADEELARFKSGAKILTNLICSEISGNRGESIAFSRLQLLNIPNVVLRNISLADDNMRSELDAVVITPNSLTIVEVKNSKKDIFIDESGNYYRTGKFLRKDCNIAQKLRCKKELLKRAVGNETLSNIPIKSVIVFTDSRIEVENECGELQTCFIDQLNYIIRYHKGEQSSIDFETMNAIADKIRSKEITEAFLPDFDAYQFKTDFAILMAKLEETNSEEENNRAEEQMSFWEKAKSFIKANKLDYAASLVVGAVAVLTSVWALRKNK